MKSLLTCALVALLLGACEQPEQRYTEDSPEIDVCKSLIAAYEAGDWAAFPPAYADTAKIYDNSTEGMTIDQVVQGWKESLPAFSKYGFDGDVDFEFVTTDEGNHWVSWWGLWKATLAANGQEFEIPIHVSAKFVDGKIAEEWGYWDNQPIAAAMAELAAAEAADAEAEE